MHCRAGRGPDHWFGARDDRTDRQWSRWPFPGNPNRAGGRCSPPQGERWQGNLREAAGIELPPRPLPPPLGRLGKRNPGFDAYLESAGGRNSPSSASPPRTTARRSDLSYKQIKASRLDEPDKSSVTGYQGRHADIKPEFRFNVLCVRTVTVSAVNAPVLTERAHPSDWLRPRAFLHTTRRVAFRHPAWPRAQANGNRTTHQGSEVGHFSRLYPLPGWKGRKERERLREVRTRIQG
jgi:hypothetical protein